MIFSQSFLKGLQRILGILHTKDVSPVFTVHAVHFAFVYRVFLFDSALAWTVRLRAICICDMRYVIFFLTLSNLP